MIEVGEYVRFKNGLISKVTECRYAEDYKKQFEPDNRLMPYQKDKYWLDNKGGCVTDINIIKHSKNIIDLIEEGDYVNGERVFATENRINDNGEKVILVENYNEWTDDGVVSNKDIKSIVTKEQFAQMEYRLEENK